MIAATHGVDAATAVAIASAVIAVVAIVVAVIAIRRADRNSSAAAIVTLYEKFSDAWRRFTEAGIDEQRREYEFAELLNVLEISCAIFLEKAIYGRSRRLLCEHLQRCLAMLAANSYTRRKMAELRHDPETFSNVVEFLVWSQCQPEAKAKLVAEPACVTAPIEPGAPAQPAGL